jgi:hypothetical protein
MPNQLKDAELIKARALPAGASAVVSDPIDTGISPTGKQAMDVEYAIAIPALTTAQLPNGQAITYELIGSDSEDMSSPVAVSAATTQTGAGGVGAAADRLTARLAQDAPRYVAARATKTGAADASAAEMTFEAVI